jgi:hypothetical protein
VYAVPLINIVLHRVSPGSRGRLQPKITKISNTNTFHIRPGYRRPDLRTTCGGLLHQPAARWL